jgi:hypothetical protein
MKKDECVFFTTVATPGWQKHCLHWGSEAKPFKLHGVQKSHLMFCQSVCSAYNYTFDLADEIATFKPLAADGHADLPG